MSQLDLSQLTPHSTLDSLDTYNYQIDSNALGQVVNDEFYARPELPGVIVTDGMRMVSMISRRVFLERMSQPYSLELYLNRPIKKLLNVLKLVDLNSASKI